MVSVRQPASATARRGHPRRRPGGNRLAAILVMAGLAWAGPSPARAAAPADAVSRAATDRSLPSPTPIVLRDDRGQLLRLAAPARRIVTLLPSLTETVCALDACDRLVGTDRWSNWPAAVRALPKLGGLEDVQVERIVALKPDLVLAPGSSRMFDRLRSLGQPVLALEPQDLADTRRVIDVVAAALGRPVAGPALWQRLEARIAAAADRVPAGWRGQRAYVEVGPAPHAAGEASFVGGLLTRLGLANIVPASLGTFPQLAPEFVVRAQPAVVLAAAADLAAMPSRPGWATLRALRDRRECPLSPATFDALVRPGPRLADAADALADCLSSLPPPVLAVADATPGPAGARGGAAPGRTAPR